MRHTEFWRRMERVLGPAYAHTWAHEHVLAGLGGQTVDQAIAAGWDVKLVWLEVWKALELPARER